MLEKAPTKNKKETKIKESIKNTGKNPNQGNATSSRSQTRPGALKRPGADLSCLRQYTRSGPRDAWMLVNACLCMCVKTVQNRSRGGVQVVKKRPRSLKSLGQIAKGCLAQGSQKTTKTSSHGSSKSSQKGSWRPPGGVQRGSEGTSRRVPPNRRVPGASKNSHFAILGGSKFDFQIFNTI